MKPINNNVYSLNTRNIQLKGKEENKTESKAQENNRTQFHAEVIPESVVNNGLNVLAQQNQGLLNINVSNQTDLQYGPGDHLDEPIRDKALEVMLTDDGTQR